MAKAPHAGNGSIEAVPEGRVLFHVGLPKTGTSSMQHAAWKASAELLKHGTYYPEAPGARLKHHHVEAAGNAMFRLPEAGPAPAGWVKKAKPWDALMRLADKSRAPRVFVSAENASRATSAQVGPLVESLPRPAHIVITLRNYAELMPSIWQQRVRGGLETTTFDEFTAAVLTGGDAHPHVARRFDTGALVRDWVDAVGADNVTVACVDKRQPEFIFELFTSLLGLPPGTITRDPAMPLNRSMTYAEAELARRIVLATESYEMSREQRNTFLLRAGLRRVQEVRQVPPGEAPIRMRKADVAAAARRAAAHAEQIVATGARVVGDLSTFSAPADHLAGTNPAVDEVPVDLAVDVVVGGMLRALGRNPLTGAARAADDE